MARLFGRFRSGDDGIAAVEFALIIPFMLTLFLASVELSFGIIADRKLTVATQTAADLLTQVQVADNALATNMFEVSAKIMEPYDGNELQLDMTGVKVAADLIARVVWSERRNHTGEKPAKYVAGQVVQLPSELVTSEAFLVMVEASYSYAPVTRYFVKADIELEDIFYMRPRIVNEIAFN